MNTETSSPTRDRLRNRHGGTLISMIGVMLVLGVLGVSIIAFTHSAEHSHLSANAGTRAYYLAESGIRYAQEVFCTEGWLHGREQTLSLQGGEQVDLVRVANNFIAVATASPGTAQEGRARVQMPLSLCGMDPNAPQPTDNFAIFGEIGVALGQRTLIEGDVAITDGDVDIQGIVDGSVLAQDVSMTSRDSEVFGHIFSSGEVDVTRGTVWGDIHSADGTSIGSQSIVHGFLFSQGDIEISAGATVHGQIHACNGDVHVGGGGTITETGEIRATGDVYLSGNTVVNGDVHAGGSIYMTGTARIEGSAYAGVSIEMGNNNVIVGGQHAPTHPKEPYCPDLTDLEDLALPDPTEFTAGGDDITLARGDHVFLPPGSYGQLSMPNNPQNDTRLYLNAGADDHGEYYFESVSFGGNTTLFLDLSGDHDIRIFVEGNMAIESNMDFYISTDGTTYHQMVDPEVDPQIAARVYWESHGNFNLKSHSNWFGSVYTPDGNLSVGNTSFLIGSFYSGGGHNITGSQIIHVAPNYFLEEGFE